jgi:hypothetical protein
VAYAIEVHPEAQAAIEALPAPALHALVEVFALLELSPWTGPSVHPLADPDAPLRNLPFGAGDGMVTYLILEREQEVHIASLVWAGR